MKYVEFKQAGRWTAGATNETVLHFGVDTFLVVEEDVKSVASRLLSQ